MRDDLPLRCYEQILPHWRQVGATYFVTFRMDDSLPQSKLNELRSMKREWEHKNPPPRSKEALDKMARELGWQLEQWLEQGFGRCLFSSAKLAAILAQSIRDGEDSLFELGCFVVMRVIQYIGRNPANAEIAICDGRLWINPRWVSLGWNFET